MNVSDDFSLEIFVQSLIVNFDTNIFSEFIDFKIFVYCKNSVSTLTVG